MFFDTPQEKEDSFELLPEGSYRVAVVDTEYKVTKSGSGRYVAVAFQVLTGSLKDRKVFANFNIENTSEQAQRIGRGQFKRFLAAIGINQALTSENEFHKAAANKTLLIDVDQQRGNDNITRNIVRSYRPKDDQTQQFQETRSSQVASSPSADDIPF